MKKKRTLSLLLSMIVCIAMVPVAVFATGEGSTAVTPAAEPAGVWSDYAATDFAGQPAGIRWASGNATRRAGYLASG